MAGPASWRDDSRALSEHHEKLARIAILERIKFVLPRLATDRSLFPDADEAHRLFSVIGMENVVTALEADAEERRRNEEIARIWNENT